MYSVADLMSREFVTVDAGDSLATSQALWDRHGTSHLPVTENGCLVGIVTPLDAVRASRSPDGFVTRVRDAMTSPVRQVRPGTPLRRAAEIMLDHRIGCVVVTDGDGRVVGLLTEADLVRFALDVIMDFDRLSDSLSRDAEFGATAN